MLLLVPRKSGTGSWTKQNPRYGWRQGHQCGHWLHAWPNHGLWGLVKVATLQSRLDCTIAGYESFRIDSEGRFYCTGKLSSECLAINPIILLVTVNFLKANCYYKMDPSHNVSTGISTGRRSQASYNPSRRGTEQFQRSMWKCFDHQLDRPLYGRNHLHVGSFCSQVAEKVKFNSWKCLVQREMCLLVFRPKLPHVYHHRRAAASTRPLYIITQRGDIILENLPFWQWNMCTISHIGTYHFKNSWKRGKFPQDGPGTSGAKSAKRTTGTEATDVQASRTPFRAFPPRQKWSSLLLTSRLHCALCLC